MYAISDEIIWAKISQVLAQRDIAVCKATGVNHPEERLPEILYDVRSAVEWKYGKAPSDTTLSATSNYMYSLCGKYLAKAKTLAAIGGGITVSATMAGIASIKAFRIELLAGVQIAVGATSYTINYANIIDQSVEVETPQSNIPEGETNQFSYLPNYSKTKVVINFTNDDGSGNNLGVPDGMLLIIRGLYISAASTTTGTTTTTAPKERQITGADLNGSNQYINSDFIGYDVIVNMRGIGDLTSDEITVLPVVGGFQLLLSGTFTSADKFTIRPNGLL